MLIQLKIQNLILVDHADISFEKGLNILTGETGAGKSAILSAIRLITGDRADVSLIGKHGDVAIVEALVSTYSLPEELVAPLAGEPLLIRREISQSGRSRAFANDQQIPLSTLRQIVGHSIELVDQSSSHLLSSIEEQRNLVDTFCETHGLVEKLTLSFSEQQKLQHRKETLIQASETRNRDLKWAEEDLQFIEEINWRPDEEEKLIQEHHLLTHSQELLEKMDSLSSLFSEMPIKKAVSLMDRCAMLDPSLCTYASQLKSAGLEMEEVTRSIHSYVGRLEANPKRLEKVEERMARIEQVKRRFGKTFDQVEAKKSELLLKIDSLNRLDQELEEMQRDILKITQENEILGKKIQEQRKKKAPSFASAIKQELHSLNLPHAQLTIDFQEIPLTAHGKDAICFLFSANAGHSPIPISECASGGELSRLLFCTKVVLSSKEKNDCLIFDEIDSNVGGQTAAILGEKLTGIAKEKQVICVTHFVQVARLAGTHFGVSKSDENQRTRTKVTKLGSFERTQEYQRMLGK